MEVRNANAMYLDDSAGAGTNVRFGPFGGMGSDALFDFDMICYLYQKNEVDLIGIWYKETYNCSSSFFVIDNIYFFYIVLINKK